MFTQLCTKTGGKIAIVPFRKLLNKYRIAHDAKDIADTDKAQGKMIELLATMADKVAKAEGMCLHLKINDMPKSSMTRIRRILRDVIKIVACVIEYSRLIRKRNEWKLWNHALCLMSLFTKQSILFSRNRCHSQLKVLLRTSDSEAWLDNRKDGDHIVYVVANHTTGKSYIGRTNNEIKRRSQHLHAIFKGSELTSSASAYRKSTDASKKLYRLASKHRPFEWALIPLDCTHGLAVKKN